MFSKTAPSPVLDLNADLGEGGFQDEVVLRHVSSASIACGGHAGDAATMRESLRLCAMYGVEAGAHPSFPDRANFGQQAMNLPAVEVMALVREQLEQLKEIADEVGVTLCHVKLHGMLATVASQQPTVARAVAQAVHAAELHRVYVRAGADCELRREVIALGMEVVAEGFADRGYAADGTLLPDPHPKAILPYERSLAQGLDIGLRGTARAVTGELVSIPAQSLGVHAYLPEAPRLVRDLSAALRQAGIRLGTSCA